MPCALPLSFSCSQVFYVSLCQKVFEVLDCVPLSNGASVLDAAPEIECDSPTHQALLSGAAASAVVWVAGVPIFFGYILYRNQQLRAALRQHLRQEQRRKAIGFAVGRWRVRSMRLKDEFSTRGSATTLSARGRRRSSVAFAHSVSTALRQAYRATGRALQSSGRDAASQLGTAARTTNLELSSSVTLRNPSQAQAGPQTAAAATSRTASVQSLLSVQGGLSAARDKKQPTSKRKHWFGNSMPRWSRQRSTAAKQAPGSTVPPMQVWGTNPLVRDDVGGREVQGADKTPPPQRSEQKPATIELPEVSTRISVARAAPKNRATLNPMRKTAPARDAPAFEPGAASFPSGEAATARPRSVQLSWDQFRSPTGRVRSMQSTVSGAVRAAPDWDAEQVRNIERRILSIARVSSTLSARFTNPRSYWAMVVLARKVALVAITEFQSRRPGVQLGMAFLVLVAANYAQLVAQPYRFLGDFLRRIRTLRYDDGDEAAALARRWVKRVKEGKMTRTGVAQARRAHSTATSLAGVGTKLRKAFARTIINPNRLEHLSLTAAVAVLISGIVYNMSKNSRLDGWPMPPRAMALLDASCVTVIVVSALAVCSFAVVPVYELFRGLLTMQPAKGGRRSACGRICRCCCCCLCASHSRKRKRLALRRVMGPPSKEVAAPDARRTV